MSNFKISSDLLIEKQELNRLKKFIVNDGHKSELLLNTKSFGIVKSSNLINGLYIDDKDCFKVENIGSNSNSVNILPGRAIDKFGNIITLSNSKTLEIPDNGLWYWIKISYKTKNTEIGKVSIDIDGKLTGDRTKFTEVLRGQPNFPTKVSFYNSKNDNIYDYEVIDVINDELAILNGSFQKEDDLEYSVIGTFTPGYIVPRDDKNIYEYDDVLFSLVEDSQSIIDNQEFFLARVKTNGLNVLIEDKRTQFWGTKSDYYLKLISKLSNPIIGVESVKWDISTTPKDKNEVNIAWGFRTTNWSVDTTQNKITINSGLGGILKENNLNNYINGSFDNWRLYCKNGEYYRIVSSNKSGTQLNIVLDFLDPSNFSTNDELWIVPDVEEIEIQANYNKATGVNLLLKENFKFPIYHGCGKIYLRIVDSKSSYKYNLKFRYKNNFEYSNWFSFPDDNIGYYSEKSFLQNGLLKPLTEDREMKPYKGHYENGFIELVPHDFNFNILFEQVIIGDKFGVDHKNLENSTLLYDLKVGKDRQIQIFHANNLVVNNDIFINLNKNKSDGTPCVNGNRFIIQIVGDIKLNLRNFKITTDYSNPTNYQLIRDITEQDTVFIRQNKFKQKSGLTMIFNYDGNDWILSISNEINSLPKNSIIQYGGSLSNFDSTGLGITDEVHGFALCNGNYGTLDIRSRVPVCYSNIDSMHNSPGLIGGSKNVYLTKSNIPDYDLPITQKPHNHRIPITGPGGRGDGGRYGVREYQSDSPYTEEKLIDIKVNSGGQNAPISIMQPYITTIFIQKII